MPKSICQPRQFGEVSKLSNPNLDVPGIVGEDGNTATERWFQVGMCFLNRDQKRGCRVSCCVRKVGGSGRGQCPGEVCREGSEPMKGVGPCGQCSSHLFLVGSCLTSDGLLMG